MKAIELLILMCVCTLLSIASVFASELPGSVDVSINYSELFGELIANPKAFLSASGVALLVYFSVQFLKSDLAKKWFKNLSDKKQAGIITILGQVYSFILVAFVVKDAEISKALIGIMGSGGAAAFFGGLKLIFGKDKSLAESI